MGTFIPPGYRPGFKQLKCSHELLKYNWINFSSKLRRFYFTKSFRVLDSTL